MTATYNDDLKGVLLLPQWMSLKRMNETAPQEKLKRRKELWLCANGGIKMRGTIWSEAISTPELFCDEAA